MPRWRSNLLSTYHINTDWSLSANLQYASSSFARLDNTDTEQNVYGAQDEYTRLGLKTTYKLNDNTSLGLGVDNITNQIAYVAHPYPGRTIYLNMAYSL